MEDKQSLNDKLIGRVVGINLIILLAYDIPLLWSLAVAHGEEGLAGLIGLVFLLIVHAGVLVILAIVFLIAGRRSLVQACLLSMLVVMLVGPGTCFGLMAVLS